MGPKILTFTSLLLLQQQWYNYCSILSSVTCNSLGSGNHCHFNKPLKCQVMGFVESIKFNFVSLMAGNQSFGQVNIMNIVLKHTWADHLIPGLIFFRQIIICSEMATIKWDTWQLCTSVCAKSEVGISPHSLCGGPWVNVYNSVRRISRWRRKCSSVCA